MKLKNPLLVVMDMDQSVAFYQTVLGLHVIMDFGANKTLTGGLVLQTSETYRQFIETNVISFGGNNPEIYIEPPPYGSAHTEEVLFDKYPVSSPGGFWSCMEAASHAR